MAYAAWSVIAGEQPTTSKWNILGTNDASFNGGTGFQSNVIPGAAIANAGITPLQMVFGLVRKRQGGTTGAASWYTPGTSNTDLTTTSIYVQLGSSVMGTGNASVAITFPVAYNQVPWVIAGTASANSVNGAVANVRDVTITGFNLYNNSAVNASTESASWLSIGQ